MKQKHYDWTDVHHFQFHCNWMVNKSSDVALFIIESNALSHALQVKMVRLYVTSVEWNVFNQNYNFLVNDSWSFIINGERENKAKKIYDTKWARSREINEIACILCWWLCHGQSDLKRWIMYEQQKHTHTHIEREKENSHCLDLV